MTDEQATLDLDRRIAEILGWVDDGCNQRCGTIPLHQQTEVMKAGKDGNQAQYPSYSTDRVAAFTWVVPVLLSAGCDVWEHAKRTTVLDGYGHDSAANHTWPILACVTNYQSQHPYSAATTAAIAWLLKHEPDRLARAVEATHAANL